MYHPTRGGVRGGRDQFCWDDVKVDKHRENYLGHSIKAPVGRWQKGKDLHWYTRDKQGTSSADALKEEIKRIKEQEEQGMREALGLAPKSSTRPQGNRLDKHEFSELVKRGSTAEDLGAGHAEATWVHGLGFAKAPRPWEDPSTLPSLQNGDLPDTEITHQPTDSSAAKAIENEPEDASDQKKRRREERKHEKREKQERHDRRDKRQRQEKRHSRDSDDRKKHKKDKVRRRHDSDSD